MGEASPLMPEHPAAPVDVGERDVLDILPHRGRALLIGTAIVDQEKKFGTSFFTVQKEHCEGHFPDRPIFPGKEYPEAVAQLLGIIAAICYGARGIGYLAALRTCKFRSSAAPDDHLMITAQILNDSPERIRGSGQVYHVQNPLSAIATVEDLLIICQPTP